MPVLTPADVTLPVTVTAGANQDGWGDTSIRVGGTEAAFTVRTIERVGMRMNKAGFVEGIADDIRSMAALAISGLLLEAMGTSTPRAQVRAVIESGAERAEALGWHVTDPAVWGLRRMLVDGVGYALRVCRLDEGFAAVADLGPFLITMHGPALPTDLTFTLKRPV